MNQIIDSSKPLVIAQFSDSHLFADINGQHHSANVYQHLQDVLANIAQRNNIDVIVFTGDLSQDHSEKSYQNFAQAIQQAILSVPVFFLAGNHDEPSLLTKYLTKPVFCQDTSVNTHTWQIHLLNSKSDTPAGYISNEELYKLKDNIEKDKFQLLMMHHHPVDVGYFIDRHGLTNQDEFWSFINELQQTNISINAIACGHVHRASHIAQYTAHPQQSVDVYTCSATSIAFDPAKSTVSSLGVAPSYRLLHLYADGSIESEIVTV